MTVYNTTSKVTGNTGTIDITVSENPGSPGNHNVEVLVSVTDDAYTCTGGDPAPSSYENTWARWDEIRFRDLARIQYRFEFIAHPESAYVVTVTDNVDHEVTVHNGTIPAAVPIGH